MARGDKPDDRGASFADLVGPVRRLRHDTVEFARPRPPPKRRRQTPDPEPFDDTFGSFEATDERHEYKRDGLQNSIFRKLRRGHFGVQDEVDLHGLDVRAARTHLARFLEFARHERMSCVRVIHGKGFSSPGLKPVLKPRVRHWLREDRRVLAFVPAPPNDGGDGALYVLLRSRAEGSE